MPTLRIATDFAYDCIAAGQSAEEATDLAGAWRGALQWLASELWGDLRLDIDDTADRSRATQTDVGTSDEAPAETLLWQAAHDLCRRDGSRPVGERWTWDVRPSVATGLRRVLAPLAAPFRVVLAGYEGSKAEVAFNLSIAAAVAAEREAFAARLEALAAQVRGMRAESQDAECVRCDAASLIDDEAARIRARGQR